MARKVGQIIARRDHRWLIRVYLDRDRETQKRKIQQPKQATDSNRATDGNWLWGIEPRHCPRYDFAVTLIGHGDRGQVRAGWTGATLKLVSFEGNGPVQ
jgi:hypothetical protein